MSGESTENFGTRGGERETEDSFLTEPFQSILLLPETVKILEFPAPHPSSPVP
jgi:hypothetical protein